MLKTGERRVFGANGRMLSKTDRNNNTTTFSYNGSGYLTAITSPAGRTLKLTYNSQGKVVYVSDALGAVASYVYDDATGLLIRVTYADGSMYRYFYTNAGSIWRLYMVMDALDNILEYHEYDGQGRAVTSEISNGVEKYTISYTSATETQVVDALNRITKVTFKREGGESVVTSVSGPYCRQAQTVKYKNYDAALNLISETDQLGYATSYQYDSMGNVTHVATDVKSAAFTYNDFGQVLTANDTLGNTKNTYDESGNLLTSTTSDGAVTKFVYNTRGQVEYVTDPRGYVTQYFYHGTTGDMTQVKNALNYSTLYEEHDGRGRVKKITNALGHITRLEYDTKNRVTKVTHPDNTYEESVYNKADQLWQEKDAKGNVTTYEYDAYGRLWKVVNALGQTAVTYGYDLMSNITSKTDILGRVTDYEYNDMNLVSKIRYPAASPGMARLEESFEYDAVGNLKKQWDTSGHLTQYEYDAGRRVKKTTDPGGYATQTGYDAHDNVAQVTDASGQAYVFEYDYNDNLKKIKRGKGQRVREYGYDLSGNKTWMKDYDGKTTYYEYDKMNRLTKITYPNGKTASYTYDALGQMLTATNETGTVRFTYDNRGRVTSETGVWGKPIVYQYDANGNRTRMMVNAAMRATYAYDALNRGTHQSDAIGTYGKSAAFSYDNAGRLRTQTINNALVSAYGYDNLDRVTGISHSFNNNSLMNFQYGYGSDTNVAEIADYSGINSYQYDAKSQLTVATHSGTPTETFQYNGIGTNVTASGAVPPTGVEYTYDANGDLKTRIDNRVAPGGVKNTEYKYDALGRLVSRKSGATTIQYTYDGDNVVLDSSGNSVAVYYVNGHGIDNKLWYWLMTPPMPIYFLKDHLGSTRALVSGNGQIAATYNYDSFGKPLGATTIRFAYAGRDYDADTELYYYRARWYDPQARRFISEDPIGLNGGINIYAYVGNNPINYTDPSGLDWIYSQSTGNIYYWGGMSPEYYGTGYAGHEKGINNPEMQSVKYVGPIPVGFYTIGEMMPVYVTSDGVRLRDAMKLEPFPSNEMFDRDSFLMHGDNKKENRSASKGCIILELNIRKLVDRSPDKILRVVP